MSTVPLWMCVVICVLVFNGATADRVHIGYSPATLLSGDMTSCAAGAVGSDCKRGLASALALFRNISAAMSPNAETFIPILDKNTAFVQAHPQNLGVNAKVFANFSITNFLVKPWIFADLEKVNATQYFEVASPAMLGTNLVLDKSDPMYYYVAGSSTIGSGDYTTTLLSALRTDNLLDPRCSRFEDRRRLHPQVSQDHRPSLRRQAKACLRVFQRALPPHSRRCHWPARSLKPAMH